MNLYGQGCAKIDKSALGTTELHCAACDGNLGELLRALLTCKHSINEPNIYGETPLHWSCHNPYPVQQVLLSSKANPNARDCEGNTPLHWACQEDNLIAVKALLANGADIDSENEDYETPIEIACQNGSRETFGFLLDRSSETCDLLSLICQYDQPQLLEDLLSNPKQHHSTSQIQMAVQTASAFNRKECSAILSRHVNNKPNQQ